MEGRGRGRGRGDGGGRGRGGDGGGRGRGGDRGGRGGGGGGGGGRGGDRGGFSGRGQGQQQYRDDQPRGGFSGRGQGQQQYRDDQPRGGFSGRGQGQQQYRDDQPRGGFSGHGQGQQQYRDDQPHGGFSGRGQGQQQYRDDQPRGAQFPGSREGRDGGGGGRFDRGGDQGSRQRDGDWACSTCGVNNFARNNQCFRCHADKTGGGSSGGAGSDAGRQGGGGYQRGGGRGRGDGGYQRGGGGGRGRGGRGGGGGRGGDRGGEIDWAAQEEMETASQSSSKSDPISEAAAEMERMKLNDLPPELAGENKNKYAVIPHRINNQGLTVGTRGRQITIEVNHVKLTFDPKVTLAIHYDCDFKPDKLSRKTFRKVMKVVRDRCYPNRNPAFDGKKNLYSCGGTPLFKGAELRETVELPPEEGDSKPLKVEVTIKEVEGESRVDLSLIGKYMNHQIREYPQKPVQVMEIVLRNAPATAGFTQVGRSFFTAPRTPITLGNGLELYHGFFQSVVLGWQTFLNVDVAHKGFPEARNVADVMCEFKNTKRFEPKPHPSQLFFKFAELENFKKFIKNTRVAYNIPGIPTSRRKCTVIGVKRPADQQTFIFQRNEKDRGRDMTVEEYFRVEKRYQLKYPQLPCLHVGDPKRNICLPPELCEVVVGQVIMKKLDQDQTRAMIKEAATSPDVRKQKIESAMKAAKFKEDDCVKEFGVSVGQQFTQVNARILTPPTIDYGNQKTDPDRGEWKVQPFKQGTNLHKWVVCSASANCKMNEIRLTIDTFRKVSRDVGMTISEPYRTDMLVDDWRITEEDLQRELLQAFRQYKKDGAQIAIVIITDKVYGLVKKVAEIDVGLLSQCIVENRGMKRMDASTGKNLLLKINTKLNGVNHTVIRNAKDKLKAPDRVMELLRGTMLMGADVTHPSPDQKEIPSVAAVTASHDPLQFKYNMVWRLQPPKQEIIGDLHNIVIRQLRYYKDNNNGRAPDRIIFYRDGVSEGMFLQVLQVEMSCIKWACRKELGRDLDVTFLVVQKRHHTRFFPTAQGPADRKGNVLPGTVVDTTITHPTEADFYMVSHASLQGTSRPTKYHKLWDDNHINEDDLEELTFFLCHMFSRCTRSVSYPAPTYYAHLGAARGRVYLEGAKVNIKQLAREMERRTIHASIVNDAPMFFT